MSSSIIFIVIIILLLIVVIFGYLFCSNLKKFAQNKLKLKNSKISVYDLVYPTLHT